MVELLFNRQLVEKRAESLSESGLKYLSRE
jgi:hypothetical protein